MNTVIKTAVDFCSMDVDGIDEKNELLLLRYFSNAITSASFTGAGKVIYNTSDIPELAQASLGHFEVTMTPCSNEEYTHFALSDYDEFKGPLTTWEITFKRVSTMSGLVLIETLTDS